VTPTPTPTWYDVLGVRRDASPEEIKAAWRDATDKFEPGSGSGQFRMFNEAADVLLDPEQRRRYDATLDAERAPETAHASTGTAPRTAAATTPAPVLERDPAPAPASDSASDSGTVPDTDEHASPDTEAPPAPARRRGSRGVSTGVLAALGALNLLTLGLVAVLTLAVLVATAITGVKVHQEGNIIDARDEAPAAAERAAKAVLSYDYRTLPADRKRASAYLTSDFRKKYLENFTLLEKQKDGTPGAAVQTKTVVTSSVLGSGVMDDDDGVVRVLVYVNQTSTRPGRDPQIFQNRVAMTMEHVGNRWLVDDLKSY
jgi:Mce-associated membrane protein